MCTTVAPVPFVITVVPVHTSDVIRLGGATRAERFICNGNLEAPFSTVEIRRSLQLSEENRS